MALGCKTSQDRSERKFRAAIDRLRNDAGTHEDHRKGNVLITISAVAKEAGMGRSTLHRYPQLCTEIRQLGSLAEGHASVAYGEIRLPIVDEYDQGFESPDQRPQNAALAGAGTEDRASH
jgi:hypothetical protein